MIDRRPRYRLHRQHTGAPVVQDPALSANFPTAAQALDCQGWKSISVVALLTGGGGPTATYQLCQEVSYKDGAGDEQKFFRVEFTLPALSHQQGILVPVLQGRVFFRLNAVAGNPTAVDLLVAGVLASSEPDSLYTDLTGSILVV